MPATKRKIAHTFSGESYTLSIDANDPFVHLDDAAGTPLAQLFVLSSLDPLCGRDDTLSVSEWEVVEASAETVFSLRARSSAWEEKIYRFRCTPHRFIYEIEVIGEGHLADVHLFGGYYSGKLRYGSGFFPSGQWFRQGFNPEPNVDHATHFSPVESTSIDLIGVPVPGRRDWFFTPTPFCFAFQGRHGWIGMGVEARAGENRWTEYRYLGQQSAFHLTLNYEGYTEVAGHYQLPAIGFDFAPSEYGVLAAHVQALRDAGHVPPLQPREKPAWWREPIFCGWGSQCYLASLVEGHAPDYARQHLYEQFLESLDRNGIAPGIIVLDDKWQVAYGENQVDEDKWSDLRGFIDEQHVAGRKVLLWFKAWDPEGVPPEECIKNAAGLPIAVDPTNPAYQQRLRASIRRMLSPSGYDADGFKIDFSARIPSGPAMHRHGDAWGLELMKVY
ncbi:MAG: hypothetical protein M3220_11005, partial [Chloroflexota bacterium]|nr:hypothetical protein [Chloroflexota bacterium]